jgi:hypothetical protein
MACAIACTSFFELVPELAGADVAVASSSSMKGLVTFPSMDAANRLPVAEVGIGMTEPGQR